MDVDDIDLRHQELRKDVDEFNAERERIKKLIGGVGGTVYSKRDNIINMIFLGIILVFFVLEVTTAFLPAYISLEISVLLVSIKIVWMIHSQHRYNHFVFWILNTLEYRVNDISKRNRKIEEILLTHYKDEVPPDRGRR